MAASLLLLVFLLGPLGEWSGLVLAGWLAAGALTLTRGGERCAVRVLCRFRTPSRDDRVHIEPVLVAVLDRYGLACADVDLYVRSGRSTNAYAAGRRSIALTCAVVTEHTVGTLDDAVLAGMLSHEIGHLVAGDARAALATAWLAAPWRIAYGILARLAAPLARHQPRALLALVITTGVVVATYQAFEKSDWVTATALCALATSIVVVPIVGAALSRAGEYAADTQAAQTGYGADLAAALRGAEQKAAIERPWLLRDHPSIDRRLRRLDRTAVRAPM